MGDENIDKVQSDGLISKDGPLDDENPKDTPTEKAVVLVPKEKVIDSLPSAEKLPEPTNEKKPEEPADRDVVLARVVIAKNLALVKAWEESEKTKADNKAYKKLSAVGAWEDSKKAVVDALLKKIEEKYERKKAEYAEKMNNKNAEIHKEAEEKKAIVDAQRSESILKIEESAAKFRATGNIPKKFGCFGF